MNKGYPAYTDIELVNLLHGSRQEAEAAFTEVYRRYSSMIHAYCSKVFINQLEAEDVFQETFIKFFQSIKPGTTAVNLSGYLLKIARNLCLNVKREQKPMISIDNMTLASESLEFSYERKEVLDLINMAIELLEFEYREAFVLREYNDLPYQDIADICGISLANAKSRVFRAKQKIKCILAPYLKELG